MTRKPLIAKATGGNDFAPASAGPHAAICIDVVARGLQQTTFGMKDKIWVIWAIDEDMEDGQPQIVLQQYTNSLHEKSQLGIHLSGWRGRQFNDAERAGFDLEKVVGKKCLLNITHNTKGERTYANVSSIMPLPKAMQAPEISAEYERHIDRNPSRDIRSNFYSEQGNPVLHQQPQNEPALADAFVDDGLPF
jgi:hypothetical protein